MALSIFLETNHKITIQVWSIGCLLEELTQNPIAGTMLALMSTHSKYKKSKMRTVRLHSVSEELKEKMVCITSRRHRKDIQMAKFCLCQSPGKQGWLMMKGWVYSERQQSSGQQQQLLPPFFCCPQSI